MKRILIVALILILPSFYTVSACSPSGGDYWFTYDTKIETDDLPVGLTIRQDGEKYYINNSSVSNVDIYSDIGSANSTYYRLNNDNVFESTLFTKWKQIELPRGQGLDLTPIVTTQYYKSISKAEDLPAGEYLPNKLGDSRPENIKVPDPITFKIPYFSIDKSGELNVILTFKLNPSYRTDSQAKGIEACNSASQINLLFSPIGILICCSALLVLIIALLIIIKIRRTKKVEETKVETII